MNRILIFLFSAVLIGCGSPKELVDQTLKNRSASTVLKKMSAEAKDYDWFSAKLSGKATLSSGTIPITANLRIRKDSVIWLSVSALLGIEVGRIHITPDSIKLMNRINSSYWKGSLEQLKQQLGVSLPYRDIQSLLVGQFLPPKGMKFKSELAEKHYLLSNKKRKPLPQLRLWVAKDFLPFRYELQDELGRMIQLEYASFDRKDKRWVPSEVSMLFQTAESTMQGNLKYSKVNVNQPKKIKFTIPESYVPMD